MPRDPVDKPNPHSLSFVVWKKSMNLRHLIEIIIFFLLLIVFQYEVSLLNTDLHISIDELVIFRKVEAEIVQRGGYTLYQKVELGIEIRHGATGSHEASAFTTEVHTVPHSGEDAGHRR